MRYHYSASNQTTIDFTAKRLTKLLQSGKKVLWLLSGGSGGLVCAEVSKRLRAVDKSNLYVTLTDERYGEVNHKDENMRILYDHGFSLPGATVYRPLSGESLSDTVSSFGNWLKGVDQKVDYVFAVLGIGEDGHTAGIKPHSPAVESSRLVEGYQGDDFKRITITPRYLRGVNEAVVQAFGESKHIVIQHLLFDNGKIEDFPMYLIRDIAKVNVFSDYIAR